MSQFSSLSNIIKKFENLNSFPNKHNVSTPESKKPKTFSKDYVIKTLKLNNLGFATSKTKNNVAETKLIDFVEEGSVTIDYERRFDGRETNLISFGSSESVCSESADDEGASSCRENGSTHSEDSVWSEEDNLAFADEWDLVNLVDELINEEEEYVMELNKIISFYIENDPTFDRIPLHIFRNCHEIYLFHCKDLLHSLKAANYDLATIAEVFINNQPNFMMYNYFTCKNEEQLDIVNAHLYFCRHFIHYFGQNHDLKMIHINPFRRLSDYCVHFVNLLVYCSKSEMYSNSGVIKNNLRSAKQFFESLISKINLNGTMNIIQNLHVNLCTVGELLKQDLFYVIDINEKSFSARCFLFEKLLVLTTVIGTKDKENLIYYDSVKMENLSYTFPSENTPISFNIRCKIMNTKYCLVSLYAIQLEWALAIQKCRLTN